MSENKINIIEEHYIGGKGQINYKYYELNGKIHNSDGPAIQRWHENGQLKYQAYFVKGDLYNVNGPARQSWDENGKLIFEEFYYKNEIYNSLDELRRSVKMMSLM